MNLIPGLYVCLHTTCIKSSSDDKKRERHVGFATCKTLDAKAQAHHSSTVLLRGLAPAYGMVHLQPCEYTAIPTYCTNHSTVHHYVVLCGVAAHVISIFSWRAFFQLVGRYTGTCRIPLAFTQTSVSILQQQRCLSAAVPDSK